MLLLLITAFSSVYHVIPDDHYTTNNNTYTLQHYLNNVNKYFTSHTQLHFLPGQYYLNTDLIIQHVSNLSLIGNRTNEVINSVIKCTSPAGIVVVGSSNIAIANIVMNECGNYFNHSVIHDQLFTNNYPCRSSLLLFNCWTVSCTNFRSTWQHKPSGVKLVNALGNTTLLNVVSTYLILQYGANSNSMPNNSMIMHTIHIENFKAYNKIGYTYAIDIQQHQSNTNIVVTLINTNFTTKLALYIRHINSLAQTIVTVANCSFNTNPDDELFYSSQQNYDESLIYNDDSNNSYTTGYGCNEYIDNVVVHYDSIVYSYFNNYMHTMTNKIQFVNSSFANINNSDTSKLLHFSQSYFDGDVKYLVISLSNCVFYNNYYVQPMSIKSYSNQFRVYYVSVLIKNVTVSSNVNSYTDVISANLVSLYIENVKFTLNNLTGLSSNLGSIITATNSYVQFSGYNEFSCNNAFTAISGSIIHVQENTVLNFTLNTFYTVISTDQQVTDVIHTCVFQYTSKAGNLDKEFQQGQKLNYSIVFVKNTVNSNEILIYYSMHCAWDSSSAFISSIPLQVNQRFIATDDFMANKAKNRICLCDKTGTRHCNEEKVGPYYPGQTVSFNFTLDDMRINVANIEIRRGQSDFICDDNKFTLFQIQFSKCSAVQYTIKHTGKWCELILTATIPQIFPGFGKPWTERYTILLQPCPKGFTLHPQGYCQCDPILSSHIPSLTTCDIDHQTIPRPANSWISAHTINNSHSYHVSLHCPFDYCLPHSSQLNLSTPDSQCQFNRSGVLCGQCQHGLSTVFGSSQCKHCSSVYLLIIIPIGIVGLIFVVLLFTLNLTVTNGDINSFLLYINIVTINSPIFFPTGESVMYAFVSLANLDLGIETCFYNGMDDYTKMWLQLVFPIYLIFIATLLIIASRYSTTIQRLTARRALPVLATLFLLSYTKVLLTVSNALFSYTSITHLPSNHTTLVWSVQCTI